MRIQLLRLATRHLYPHTNLQLWLRTPILLMCHRGRSQQEWACEFYRVKGARGQRAAPDDYRTKAESRWLDEPVRPHRFDNYDVRKDECGHRRWFCNRYVHRF